jgi:hypothetical protein
MQEQGILSPKTLKENLTGKLKGGKKQLVPDVKLDKTIEFVEEENSIY